MSTGQSFKQQFETLSESKDEGKQTELLSRWEAADINDPELYVAYFNFYLAKSKRDFIEIGQNPKGEHVLEITNIDSTQKEPAGYIYENATYDKILLNKGFEYIERGIARHPDRLDMRFGKIYMYGEIEDYDSFTSEILKVIDYSSIIKNKWKWTENKPVEDPQKFMLSSIQEYVSQLYNTNNDSLLDNMRRIAETVLKYYPDHVESLSNLSIVFMLNEDYDSALVVLLKAEHLASKDHIVLCNIAHAYKMKGNRSEAIRYYEKAAQFGNEETRKFSKDQIDKLQNK